MHGLRKTLAATMGILVVGLVFTSEAHGDPLTIYQVQYNTNGDGASNYHDRVIDCVGGIVVGKFAGFRPRLILQDPDYPDGWGGIQAKDWIYPYDMFSDAQLGDWIEFTNMKVEEYVGTTFLQRQLTCDPGYSIVSLGNPLPPPAVVSVSDIAAPISTNGGWYVENHDAEPYESMRVVVRDVIVTEMELGKEPDNYNLQNPGGESCWSTDYMNESREYNPEYFEEYHPFVLVGQHFCAVAGVLEQYTTINPPAEAWDYYQLVTQSTVDLAICGDADTNGYANLDDLPRFEECLIGPACDEEPEGCDPPAWTEPPAGLDIQHCLMMDQNYDGDVDLGDFGDFQMLLGDPQPRMRKEKRSDE